MRKTILAATLALSCASFYVQADTPTGIVHFTGLITASTCDIAQGNDSGQANQTVTLNTVDAKDFGNSVGDKAAASEVPFSIKVEGCTASLGSLNVAFEGANTTASGLNTALAVTGGATGVGISIYRAGTAVNFTSDRADARSSAVTINDFSSPNGDGSTSFNYTVAYVRTVAGTGGSNITEGTAKADANYVLAYY